MAIDRLVVDASALIVLFRADYGDLRGECFEEVVVPIAVALEIDPAIPMGIVFDIAARACRIEPLLSEPMVRLAILLADR